MKTRILVLMLLMSVSPAFAAPSAPLPRLVDLGATKCIPCKQMVPVLAALKSDYVGQLEVIFIDVWEDSAAGKPYGIRLIPTQVFVDASGKELYRHEGYWSKEAIIAKFKELGVALTPPPASKDGRAM